MEVSLNQGIKVFIVVVIATTLLGATFMFLESDFARISPKAVQDNRSADTAFRSMQSYDLNISLDSLHLENGDSLNVLAIVSGLVDSHGDDQMASLTAVSGADKRVISYVSGGTVVFESDIIRADGTLDTDTGGVYVVHMTYTDAYGVSKSGSSVILVDDAPIAGG